MPPSAPPGRAGPEQGEQLGSNESAPVQGAGINAPIPQYWLVGYSGSPQTASVAQQKQAFAALYREYGATEKPNPMTLWADMYRFHEAGLCNCHRHAKLKGLN